MAATQHLGATVAWCGFALGLIFGAVGNKTNFCTMGAVSDIVNIGDWGRMRMWLLAIAVAILGSHGLWQAEMIDLSKSIYTAPNFTWLSFVVGGFLFGVGMTLGSGCGSKTLIRIGAGNLKSVVVYVFLGISAYMTLRGLFGQFRVSVLQPVAINFEAYGLKGQDLPSLLAGSGVAIGTLRLVIAAIFSAALLIFILKDREFRARTDYVVGGVVVGLLVVAGWYVTAHLGYKENPDTLEMTFFGTNTRAAESISFVAPLAYSLELLMLWTDKSLTITFGIMAALGIVAGSFAYAIMSRTFRWEGFRTTADLGNHIIGGVLMGVGGITALGCTIGQGISGFSTLALGSILTFCAIIAGSAATMKYQYWKMLREN
ncbi:MAG TPA: YeeE/YedE family protein [Burkholderiales bacterium]|nr:YeeE/YedE family protein [Burkholderiales bacterium]